MIKHITVINYIDIASNALMNLVNTVITKENRFIDISNRKIQRMFITDFNNLLSSHKTIGQKVIIINTCPANANWKSNIKRFKTQDISSLRYAFKTKKLKMSLAKLSCILNKFWKYLKTNKTYITLETKEGDSLDIVNAVKYHISSDFLNIIKPKFSLLVDNSIYVYYSRTKLNYKLPDFLKEKVWTKLLKNGVV